LFKAGSFEKVAVKPNAHDGPIKCMATMNGDGDDVALYIASGSMDHSLLLHEVDADTYKIKLAARCKEGHASAIGSADFFPANKTLASGDWDGGLCLWKIDGDADPSAGDHQPSKKSKTGLSSAKEDEAVQNLTPLFSLQAHSSKISGLSWGNYEKNNASQTQEHLITGSWDHSLKVWNIERQDCLLTLNGSRVISCLDTSHHSSAVVATGHPDCTIRLWDVRTDNAKESALSVSDNTFRPSHKAWVSAVQWSRQNPYHLASTSHDGSVKLWDIRSSLPLQTVRAFPKTDKGLAMVYGDADGGMMYTGGTDSIVKQFRCGDLES
jgi:ribosome biogenesis protein YTM1